MQEAWIWSLGQEDPLEEEMANPLHYSCLENPMDRGAWQATVHGVAELDMTDWVYTHAHTTNTLDWVALTTDICFSQFWRLEVQGLDASQFDSWWGPSSLPADSAFSLCLHMALVSSSPYKGINPIIWTSPPRLHPNPITSQKPRLQTPTHWRLKFDIWILGVGCWRRLLRVPRTARRSSQLILKEINSEYSLEGLMLKLKLQYFVHLMRSADSL